MGGVGREPTTSAQAGKGHMTMKGKNSMPQLDPGQEDLAFDRRVAEILEEERRKAAGVRPKSVVISKPRTSGAQSPAMSGGHGSSGTGQLW